MIVEPKMVLRVVVRENKITHEGIFTEYTAHLVGKDDNAILAGATWQTVLLLKGFLVKELSVHLPARTWNRTYWGLARIDPDAIEIHQPRVPIR